MDGGGVACRCDGCLGGPLGQRECRCICDGRHDFVWHEIDGTVVQGLDEAGSGWSVAAGRRLGVQQVQIGYVAL